MGLGSNSNLEIICLPDVLSGKICRCLRAGTACTSWGSTFGLRRITLCWWIAGIRTIFWKEGGNQEMSNWVKGSCIAVNNISMYLSLGFGSRRCYWNELQKVLCSQRLYNETKDERFDNHRRKKLLPRRVMPTGCITDVKWLTRLVTTISQYLQYSLIVTSTYRSLVSNGIKNLSMCMPNSSDHLIVRTQFCPGCHASKALFCTHRLMANLNYNFGQKTQGRQ